MNRELALDSLMELINGADVIISTTGLTSRYLYQKYDNPQHFYNPGAMGLVSSIGLGISLFFNSGRVFIIDGDGSLLMNFSTIITIGINATHNLVHIVLDNASYDSCSGEPTNTNRIELEGFAKLSGYNKVKTLCSISEINNIREELETGNGPYFLVIKITSIGSRSYKRPMNLPLIKERFMSFIETKSSG